MKTNKETKSPKLIIIIAESEIEPIPKSIQHHPQIKSYVKKKNKQASNVLLDASYHHASMKKLQDWSRRGRPDIVHRCVLFALDSWANHEGLLKIYIHTRNDYVITINPKTRLPRQYHRFIGLIEQLLETKQICFSDEILLTYEKKTLKQLLEEQKGEAVLLWEKGKLISIVDLIESKKGFPLIVVIGGFPHGDFHQAHRLIEQKFSIESESYTASYLTAKTLITFEQVGCNHK